METTSAPLEASGPFGAPLPWIFIDGAFCESAEGATSLHANALHYGTGTFEGMRAFWNDDHEDLYLLEGRAHYARLQASARILGRDLPHTPDELVAATAELLRRNEVRGDAYVRPLYIVVDRQLPVRMDGMRMQLSIAVSPIVGDYVSLNGLRCKISTWRRAPDDVMPSRAKLCGSYVGPALAKSEAMRGGYDEALMLNTRGFVAEATTANVFMRRGDEWITPAVTDDILEGVTRGQLLELLAEMTGRPVSQRSVHPSEIRACDELLLCGTAALVAPVVEVDDRPVGDGEPGATSKALLDELQAIARRVNGAHPEWTTSVYGGTR